MKLSLPLLVALAGQATASADDAPPANVPQLLADPAALAAWLRDHDPHISAARAKIAAAYATSQQARVIPNPSLDFTAGGFVLGRTTATDANGNIVNAHLGLADTTVFGLGVSELVEIGKRGPRKQAADLRVDEARENAVASLGDRLGDATTTLGKLAYVAARRDEIAQQLAAAQKLRDNEKIRVDKQDLAEVDFARIELDTQALELQLARAEADVVGAAAGCTATLMAKCTAAGLDDNSLIAAAPLPATLPEPQAAVEGRAERVANKIEGRALGSDAELARARRLPDVTFGIGYTLDNLLISGDQHQTLAFTVGIPLPLFDRGEKDSEAALANAKAIELEDQAEVRADRGVYDALDSQRVMLQQTIDRLDKQAIPTSTKIIAQTQKAFDLGQARLADLILVQRAHRELLLQVLDTQFELFTTRVQMRHVLGLDDQTAREKK